MRPRTAWLPPGKPCRTAHLRDLSIGKVGNDLGDELDDLKGNQAEAGRATAQHQRTAVYRCVALGCRPAGQCSATHHLTHQHYSASLLALHVGRTSMLSRLARNQEDWANKKSPASTATRVPNMLFTVSLPAGKATGVEGGGRAAVSLCVAQEWEVSKSAAVV